MKNKHTTHNSELVNKLSGYSHKKNKIKKTINVRLNDHTAEMLDEICSVKGSKPKIIFEYLIEKYYSSCIEDAQKMLEERKKMAELIKK